jgi:hypothetical protein
VTQDGHFRLFTSMIGMCVTDAWKVKNYELRKRTRQAEDKQESIKHFADKLAAQLLNRGQSLMLAQDGGPAAPVQQIRAGRPVRLPPPGPIDDTTASSVSYSAVVVEKDLGIVQHPHSQQIMGRKLSNAQTCLRGNRGRIKRNRYTAQVRCVWCARVKGKEKKTTLKCLECGVGFCKDDTGRMCWSLHVAANGPPELRKRKRSSA